MTVTSPSDPRLSDLPMVILEDSRQQPGKHENIRRWLDARDIPVRRCKLYVGDYIIANRGDVAVDTKMDVRELISNVYQEHERFRAECLRAQQAGIRLIILVEETLPGGRLDRWVPPLLADGRPASTVDPVRLRNTLITMHRKYGVVFRFCDPSETGQMLLSLLAGQDKAGDAP